MFNKKALQFFSTLKDGGFLAEIYMKNDYET